MGVRTIDSFEGPALVDVCDMCGKQQKRGKLIHVCWVKGNGEGYDVCKKCRRLGGECMTEEQ